MIKILIITSGVLPVPAVKGGAVENLIQMLLDENEKKYKNEITVASIYDERSEKEAKQYKYAKFEFFKENKIFKYFRGIINKILPIYIGNEYITQIKRKTKFEQYDYVVLENSPQYATIIRKKVKGKLVLHLHNDRLNKNSKNAEKILNCFDSVFVLSKYIRTKS